MAQQQNRMPRQPGGPNAEWLKSLVNQIRSQGGNRPLTGMNPALAGVMKGKVPPRPRTGFDTGFKNIAASLRGSGQPLGSAPLPPRHRYSDARVPAMNEPVLTPEEFRLYRQAAAPAPRMPASGNVTRPQYGDLSPTAGTGMFREFQLPLMPGRSGLRGQESLQLNQQYNNMRSQFAGPEATHTYTDLRRIEADPATAENMRQLYKDPRTRSWPHSWDTPQSVNQFNNELLQARFNDPNFDTYDRNIAAWQYRGAPGRRVY